VLRKIAKRMAPMDRAFPVSQPRSAPHLEPEQQSDEQPHHHPVPSGLVRLYGLLAVLFVLLPEWMADLRQLSRNVRIQAHEVDRDRLSITLRRRREARRRRPLKGKGALTNPDLAQAIPASRSVQQPHARPQWPVTVGRAALLVGVGAGLVWGANQLKTLPRLPLPQAGSSGQAERTPAAVVPAGQLLLQSSGPSWVEVRGLDGETLYGAILQGQVLLPLGRGVKVLAGRPDLVRVSVAGERPKVLGRIDQIAWVEVPVREGLAPP
jgi:hypothetical protein